MKGHLLSVADNIASFINVDCPETYEDIHEKTEVNERVYYHECCRLKRWVLKSNLHGHENTIENCKKYDHQVPFGLEAIVWPKYDILVLLINENHFLLIHFLILVILFLIQLDS